MSDLTEFTVITRYRVADVSAWLRMASDALAPLAGDPTCLGADICASLDDPQLMVITTQWPTVGAYRRAMSSFDVKMHTVPLLSQAVDEPTTFEVLHHNGPGGPRDFPSARAADADTVTLHAASAPHVPPRT